MTASTGTRRNDCIFDMIAFFLGFKISAEVADFYRIFKKELICSADFRSLIFLLAHDNLPSAAPSQRFRVVLFWLHRQVHDCVDTVGRSVEQI